MTPANSSPEWEVQLMKFAAGELSPTEEADLLAQCEIEPTRYRDLALAMVEERRLAGAFRASMVSPTAGRAPSRRRISSWAIATAASVALVIGAVAGNLYERGMKLPTEMQASGAAGVASGLRNEAAPSEAKENLPPVLSAKMHQAVAQSMQPLFSQAELQAFRECGYEVDEEPRVYVLGDGQGNQIAVPQRKLLITRVSN